MWRDGPVKVAMGGNALLGRQDRMEMHSLAFPTTFALKTVGERCETLNSELGLSGAENCAVGQVEQLHATIKETGLFGRRDRIELGTRNLSSVR